MKAGYYLSERGNFQVWYPLGFFEDNTQRVDVVEEGGVICIHNFTLKDIILVELVLEFEFMGDL